MVRDVASRRRATRRAGCWIALLAALMIAPAAQATGDRWIRLGDDARWTGRCQAGAETRPGASCNGPAVARLEVALPALRDGDRIALAAALRPAPSTGPVRVRATLATRDGRSGAALWTRTLDPGSNADAGWQSTVAAIPAPAGDVRSLVLEAEAAGNAPAAPVAWARPVLRRRDAAPAVPGIVLVVLDGLRADRVKNDEGPHPTAPILARLIRTGIVFMRAWASTPNLHASHVSMLTGRHPCVLAAPRAAPTLATTLQAAGWATAVIGDDPTLERLAGFDRVFAATPGSFADETRLVDRWLGEIGGAPFFVVVQSRQIERPDLLPPAVRAKVKIDASASRTDRARALYDAAIGWTDQSLGGLFFGSLARRRLAGRAVLIVTSGAGFALGEHGDVGPARTLWAESLHVPLVVHDAALGRPRQVPFPVELRDLPRTLLALAAVAPEKAMPGESLVPPMRGATLPPRSLLGLRRGLTAAVLRTARFAWFVDGDRLALYDIAADPDEQTDIAAEHPTVAADGRRRLETLRAACAPRP
jgi:arylsulfatase A-like enzyme